MSGFLLFYARQDTIHISSTRLRAQLMLHVDAIKSKHTRSNTMKSDTTYKFLFSLFAFLLASYTSLESVAQTSVWQANIRETRIDVRTAPVVLAKIAIDVPNAGNVVVQFDGVGIPDAGDRLVLAASDEPDWKVNDGNVNFDVVDNDINRQSFSHTRLYNVTPGEHTFYAVAHNWVEQDGDGEASIYGSLTVKYFSFENSTGEAYHQGIQATSVDVRGNAVVLAEQTIRTSEAGRVLVRFDGACTPDVGDRISLAASNTPDWAPNDGVVSCEAANADVNKSAFSHSRVYDVAAGDHTFYAVAENWVSQTGNGIVSVYGSLTVEFYPESSMGPYLLDASIVETNIDVRTSTITLAELTVDAPLPGKVVVHFDGNGIPDADDRLVLAASDTQNWTSNEGNVNLERLADNRNTISFSHTRVYDIDFGGLYTFYAVANNFVEEGGDGEASVYGNFTVQYYPDLTRVSNEDLPAAPSAFTLQQNFPNPFADVTAIRFTTDQPAAASLKVYDLLGKEIRTLYAGQAASTQEVTWDGTDNHGKRVANGVYIYQLTTAETTKTRRMTLIR